MKIPNSAKEHKFVIYKVTCTVTEKAYIGLTVRGVGPRFMRHLRDANKFNQTHFHRAIRKYGVDAFVTEILYVGFSKKHLPEAEKLLIAEFDTYRNGYNSTKGGDGRLGFKVSDKTKKQMSESRKKYLAENPVSEETRKKVGEFNVRFHTGRKRPPETGRKISEAKMGEKHPGSHKHTIVAPDGTVHITYALERFCRENGLSPMLARKYLNKGKVKPTDSQNFRRSETSVRTVGWKFKRER